MQFLPTGDVAQLAREMSRDSAAARRTALRKAAQQKKAQYLERRGVKVTTARAHAVFSSFVCCFCPSFVFFALCLFAGLCPIALFLLCLWLECMCVCLRVCVPWESVHVTVRHVVLQAVARPVLF